MTSRKVAVDNVGQGYTEFDECHRPYGECVVQMSGNEMRVTMFEGGPCEKRK